jgi:hypothetical protein
MSSSPPSSHLVQIAASMYRDHNCPAMIHTGDVNQSMLPARCGSLTTGDWVGTDHPIVSNSVLFHTCQLDPPGSHQRYGVGSVSHIGQRARSDSYWIPRPVKSSRAYDLRRVIGNLCNIPGMAVVKTPLLEREPSSVLSRASLNGIE